ncbi:MAG: squalene--hopene cyclase [Pseudomonadota bacterium]
MKMQSVQSQPNETLLRVDALERRALIAAQADALRGAQQDDGHFVFHLEADSTIPSEYILLQHWLGDVDDARQRAIANYIRARQNDDGSWPLFEGGAGNISASVKAYWALKLSGADPESQLMTRARGWILEQGGAATANVFTRFSMALFGQVPWRAVPVLPVECMLLPKWFPFHLQKIAYWSRTVLVPLLVLYARRARGVNPSGLRIDELFVTPPDEHPRYNINPTGRWVGSAFLGLDRCLRVIEPAVPAIIRSRAIGKAETFVLERLNGENGLGAIFPAMANAVMMLRVLGYADDHPAMTAACDALDRLLTNIDRELTCQPCFSPVWDTGLTAHALLETGQKETTKKALDWLAARQILDRKGDWAATRPELEPGGWAFQYDNPAYPDVDDTAVVAMAMHRADPDRYALNIERACDWLAGMQSRSGGWGAFDADNEYHYLNAIPFADHGALLDPPTADVTARCVGALAQVDADRYAGSIREGVSFLRKTQEADGSWFGRWGANYVYGTWSALSGLNAAGEDMWQPWIIRAVDWLETRQNHDGGWGEGLESYADPAADDFGSTPSQTAWAILALMAAGRWDNPAVARGAEWLQAAPRDGVRWREPAFTGVGFPRVFYLKYHGYSAFFPLWALARYQKLTESNAPEVPWGL